MNKSTKNVYKISLLGFICLSLASLTSIRNFPTMALNQWKLVTLTIFAIVLFLIPISLTSAELATGWSEGGGVYKWVKEAFGQKWGFTA
ncbi:MAG: amino acid permease, partial [Methanobrevibacter sp.]|nr:amino acid permease [Methanobrevibacter sp.]